MEGASRLALSQARARIDALVAAPPPDATGAAAAVRRGVAKARASVGGGVDLDQLATELSAVGALLRGEHGLRRTLTDPGAAPAGRARLFDRLFANRVTDTTLDLVRPMVETRWNRPLDFQLAVEQLAVEALLGRAQVDGSLDDVEDELFRFSRILDRTPRLDLALTDPALPADRKQGLLDRLLGGRATAVTVRLIELAVQERTRGDLGRTIESYTVLAAARRQRTVAIVRVARPIDDAQAERLRVAISRYFGREVQIQLDVDPDMLGGVIVRVGDEVVDGSIVRRLAGARRRLLR